MRSMLERSVAFLPEEPSGESPGKTDSNMRSMLECRRHVAISVFEPRAKSSSRVPRAEALHALHETYRQIKDLGLGLQDTGGSFH